jgi:hypothetical protein
MPQTTKTPDHGARRSAYARVRENASRSNCQPSTLSVRLLSPLVQRGARYPSLNYSLAFHVDELWILCASRTTACRYQ